MWQKPLSGIFLRNKQFMLTISKDLFTAWNDANLFYCHWKSNEHLLPGLDGTTDLDVLLSRDDKEKGEQILQRLDFLKCKSQFGSRYPDVYDWIGYDKVTGALIHLHLHFALVTGHKGLKEYSLPWAEKALQTRVFNEEYGVYTIEPNLEMVTLYTRIGLKADIESIVRCRLGRFHFSKDVQREIDWLKERVDLSKVRDLLDIYYGEEAAAVFSIMQQKNIDATSYMCLRQITEKTFKKSSRVKCFVRIKEGLFYIYQKRLKHFLQNFCSIISKKVPASEKGMTIAFLGQDGAGKTTVTKQLIKWLSWKMDVRYVYLGSGDNYFSLKRTLIRKMPTNGTLRIVRSFLALTEIRDITKKACKNIIRSEKYVKKGGIVIYDRFPQMEFAGICDGPKIREKVEKNFGKGFKAKLFLPLACSEEKYIKKIVTHHPNIVFKLILPPEESIRRKPQENYEGIKRKHEIVKSLAFDESEVYVIDATMPYEEEILRIKSTIWQHIQK